MDWRERRVSSALAGERSNSSCSQSGKNRKDAANKITPVATEIVCTKAGGIFFYIFGKIEILKSAIGDGFCCGFAGHRLQDLNLSPLVFG